MYITIYTAIVPYNMNTISFNLQVLHTRSLMMVTNPVVMTVNPVTSNTVTDNTNGNNVNHTAIDTDPIIDDNASSGSGKMPSSGRAGHNSNHSSKIRLEHNVLSDGRFHCP